MPGGKLSKRHGAAPPRLFLFDRRFLASPYRDHLPADWLPEEEAGALAGEPAAAAEEFFRPQVARSRIGS